MCSKQLYLRRSGGGKGCMFTLEVHCYFHVFRFHFVQIGCSHWILLTSNPGVSNSFSRGATSVWRLPSKGPNVIVGLCKCNYSLAVASSALLPGRNRAPGQIKQGGGPDLARGPCVCHLCSNS